MTMSLLLCLTRKQAPYQQTGRTLSKHSSKMATAQYVDLADTWMRGQYNEGASDPLSYSFTIVTDHNKRQKTNTSGSDSANKEIPISVSEGVKSHEARSPTSQPTNPSTANLFTNSQSKPNNFRYRFQIDTYNSNLYSNPSSHDFDTQSSTMPKG